MTKSPQVLAAVMTNVAAHLGARRTGPGRWRARCPAHQDHTPSLDITAGDDGRTLLLCRAGCPTPEVLRAAGLDWSDLFRERASSQRPRRVDPRDALQRRAERGLRAWADHTGRQIRDDVYLRHKKITLAERLLAADRDDERAWTMMGDAYHSLAKQEWLLDLLDSRRPEDWSRAHDYLDGRTL